MALHSDGSVLAGDVTTSLGLERGNSPVVTDVAVEHVVVVVELEGPVHGLHRLRQVLTYGDPT